jgi:hypothetical protein
MRIVLKVVLGIVSLFVVVRLGIFLIALFGYFQVPTLTVERAHKLFDEVGGINAVNREAQVLIARCASEDLGSTDIFLYSEDLKDTPAISSLYSKCEAYSGDNYSGTSIRFDRRSSNSYLEIKFGNHYSLKRIYIFDMNATTALNPSRGWVQLAPNIFIKN